MPRDEDIWTESASELSLHARDHLVARTDAHIRWDPKSSSWKTCKSELTGSLLEQHFRGDVIVGAHPVSADCSCKFMAFDIDAHDDDMGRADGEAKAIEDVLSTYNVPFIEEDSDGRGGRHFWVLLDPGASGEVVLDVAAALRQEAGVRCESFPKGLPSKATPFGGNAIRLPGKHHRREHWSRFRVDGRWLDATEGICCWLDLNPVPIAAIASCLKVSSQKSTEENRRAQRKTEEHTRPDLSSPLSSSVKYLIEMAIRATLPETVGQRNKKLFGLARRLNGIEELSSEHPKSLKPIVRDWHQRALPAISTRPFDETWADFIRGWPKVKETHPMIIERAWFEAGPRARSGEQLCDAYDSDAAKGLLMLCEVLSKREGNQIFYLSCRDAGRVAGVSHKQAANILNMFVADGVLVLEQKGSPSGQASRYRFAEACSTCAEDK